MISSCLQRKLKKRTTPETGITLIRGGAPLRYTGDLSEDGKREGFGRTVNNNGITLYEGEYKNDLREGFGVHHYRSGAVSYIGDFKDDQREGFGVSFRESDHALTHFPLAKTVSRKAWQRFSIKTEI